jgi:AcrR family transcriptional regulator
MREHRVPRVGWGRIVQVGAELIWRNGMTRFELADVARELGVEVSEVTYWFAEPTDVLIAVLDIRKNWFLDEVRTRMAPLPTQSARLRELIEMTVVDQEATFFIELWRLARKDDALRRARQSLSDEYRKTIASIIRAGQQTGEFGQKASPDKVALVLASLLTGFSVNLTLGDPAVTPESMLETLLDTAGRLLDTEFSPAPAR